MKIVVTGAFGHIGSGLIRALPNFFPQCEIIMIDNLMTQRFPSLFELPNHGHYRFVEGDVCQMNLKEAFANADVVIHLAAITDAAASFDKPDEVEQVNFTATENVADTCMLCGVPMIMASSTSVYGTQETYVDENCGEESLRPQSPYAETKLKEEALISEKVSRGLLAIKFRYGTIYGTSPGMRFHTAVNKFCYQAVMAKPLTVWSTAYEQKRPYLHLEDCINAIAFVIKQKLFDGMVYNVVSTNATVREVIEHIRDNIPNVKVDFVDHKIMNQLSYEVLNSRLEEAGFETTGSMKQGIADTIQLIRNSNSAVI